MRVPDAADLLRRLGAVACAVLPSLAQEPPPSPVLRALCAGLPSAADAPALHWLVGTMLPRLPEWPRDLAAGQTFALEVSATGTKITPASATVPADCFAAGSLHLGDHVALFACRADGTEDWFLPPTAPWPAPWTKLLDRLGADEFDLPRTVDVTVLVAHLLGPLPEDDPRAALLRLLPAQCGEATWTAWRSPTHLRVRGRSNAGLALPALLLHLALATGADRIDRLPLRAFSARDGDRAEATRQLVRDDSVGSIEVLRSLLHADDELRLVAIDALVRRGDTAELPRIVAAAAPDHPLASLAAADAVRSLFANAAPLDRQRTRAAIVRSAERDLRAIDVEALLPGRRRTAAPADDGSQRGRLLALLLLTGIAVYGLWSRERSRLASRRAARA